MNSRSGAYTTLLIAAAVMLMLLPLVTTFDHLLAAWAALFGIDKPLAGIAPVEVRLAAGLLRAIGLTAGGNGDQLVVWGAAGPVAVQVTWNCVGWQSALLLGASLLTGLRGDYPFEARVQVVLIGVLGTAAINLLRIALVGLIAAAFGAVPAVLAHDYGGTLLTIAWLFAFWSFAHRWVLPAAAGQALEAPA
jgi:exosortase/archaeosortase family protein